MNVNLPSLTGFIFVALSPSTKVLGYFRSSLTGWPEWSIASPLGVRRQGNYKPKFSKFRPVRVRA